MDAAARRDKKLNHVPLNSDASFVRLDRITRIIVKPESQRDVTGCETFVYPIALLAAFGSAYHSRSNGQRSGD
jgi:hypothetical protein